MFGNGMQGITATTRDAVPQNPQQAIAQARSAMARNEFFLALSATDANTIERMSAPASASGNSHGGNPPNVIERERIHTTRAEAYLALKQFAKCEKEARTAVAVSDSSSPQAQYLLGCALLGQFRIQDAVDAFDVAEALMRSPQAWKYVVLPSDEAQSNNALANVNNSNATAVAAIAASTSSNTPAAAPAAAHNSSPAFRVVKVPRQYRDIGLDDPALVPGSKEAAAAAAASNGKDKNAVEFPPPLLPPPAPTYEWINAHAAWKADAALARRLDAAHTTRLLPRAGLLSGIRMLEHIAKQSASRFLIATLRNDTDYDLVYRYHTCGSEGSEQYQDASSPPPPSNTQFLFKFPHVIPPGSVGVAIIYCDSWRAKMLTLAATVGFAMQKTKPQREKEEELAARVQQQQQQQQQDDVVGRRSAKSTPRGASCASVASAASSSSAAASATTTPPSPLLRFAFSISSVLANVSAATYVLSAESPSAVAAMSGNNFHSALQHQQQQQQQQQQQHRQQHQRAAPASAAAPLPPQAPGGAAKLAEKGPTAATFIFDQSAFTTNAHSALPVGLYSKTATMGGVAQTQSDVHTIPVAYLSVVQHPGALATATGATTRISPVLVGTIAQFLPPRPLRLASCVSTAFRSVVSSFPPARFDDYPYGATFPDYLLVRDIRCSPFTVRNDLQQQQQQQQNQNQQQPQKRVDDNAPPVSTFWTGKREDGVMFRTLCFRNCRGDAVLYSAGETSRNQDYFVRLPGGTQGRCMLCRVAPTTGFLASMRSADVMWASPHATPQETDLSTRCVAKITHEVVAGANWVISLVPTAFEAQVQVGGSAAAGSPGGSPRNGGGKSGGSSALSSSAQHADPQGLGQQSGFELVAPHASTRPHANVQCHIRDISSKHPVARMDVEAGGAFTLKFLAQTDAMFVAILCSEYLVMW